MEITVKKLVEIGACSEPGEAIPRFIDIFGEDGNPSAREVFIKLAEEERSNWLFWLAYHLKGFAEAVGTFSFGNFHCIVEGQLAVEVGYVLADGNASVIADGNASVEAYGNASVRAYGNASVRAYGNASVRADGNASVRAYGNASVRADGNASVIAYGNASVEAYGNASVFLFKYGSMKVKISIKSVFACAIDRRGDGIPKLITATEADLAAETESES
jgi:hypothetical protein